MSDTHTRSVAKAVTWRLTGTLDTFIISFIITGELMIAGGIALTEVFTKIFLFWGHERVWNKIRWGREEGK